LLLNSLNNNTSAAVAAAAVTFDFNLPISLELFELCWVPKSEFCGELMEHK